MVWLFSRNKKLMNFQELDTRMILLHEIQKDTERYQMGPFLSFIIDITASLRKNNDT